MREISGPGLACAWLELGDGLMVTLAMAAARFLLWPTFSRLAWESVGWTRWIRARFESHRLLGFYNFFKLILNILILDPINFKEINLIL